MRRASWLLCPVLLTLLLLFTACEDEDATSLEGTWRASTLVLADASGQERRASLPETWTEVLSMNPDGTFSFSTTQDGRTESGTGRWSRTTDQLIFSHNGDGQIYYGIDGDHLVLSGDIPEGHFWLVWTKIN